MAALKFLETEYPMFDSNFQSFCASNSIFTVQGFLAHDLPALSASSSAARLKQGITQVVSILDMQSQQPWLNGLELFDDVRVNKHVLSTGVKGIDLLLGDGLREGQFVELVGPSSSGKTQLCLQIASNVTKKHMGPVVYVDTGNSFSPQRIERFVCRIADCAFDEDIVPVSV